MKYVKTKDGIYRSKRKHLEKNCLVLGVKENGDIGLVVKDIIKQADNIEELFDEFRGIWINYYESEKKDAHEEYHYDKEKNVFYDDFEELTPKEAIEKFDIFYGAIWTDQGLIYKAKMKGILPNGKIDWELL